MNSVPDRAEVGLDMRTGPGQGHAEEATASHYPRGLGPRTRRNRSHCEGDQRL